MPGSETRNQKIELRITPSAKLIPSPTGPYHLFQRLKDLGSLLPA
jgi:hypothetical protein